jgi:hypothetical protein
MVLPFKKVSKELITHLIVFVPSTKDVDKPISDSEFNKRVKETSSFLSELFGGITKISGTGAYHSKKGLVTERVAEVETFTDPSSYEQKKNKLHKWLMKNKSAWGQENIAVEYEEDMYWI